MTGKNSKPDLKNRGVTSREAARIYRDQQLGKANARKFAQEQPDDYGHDPRYAVPVSRQGKDKGAIHRETDILLADDPHAPERSVPVRVVRSGLRRLLGEGAISPQMFFVGEEFQSHFSAAGYDQISTVKLDGLPGGGGDVEARMTATMRSRNFVNRMLNACGYPDTSCGRAAWWIIGMGMGFAEFARDGALHGHGGGDDSRYWKAMVVTALELMVIEAQKNAKKQKQGQTAVSGDF